MKHFLLKAAIIFLAIMAGALIAWAWNKRAEVWTPQIAAAAKPAIVETPAQHRLETYLSALEWCESGGKGTALNPKDRDGTPSYSNYQWKPKTFLDYGKQYGILPATTTLAQVAELLKQYELQRSTVRHMSQDPQVNWLQQFPGCTKKIGYPPQLST